MSFEFLSLETIQEIARQYGYWAVFFGIALESLGIPLPGETITLVGGFLAGSGELNYWQVLGTGERWCCSRQYDWLLDWENRRLGFVVAGGAYLSDY
jgi:hypothetical protein